MDKASPPPLRNGGTKGKTSGKRLGKQRIGGCGQGTAPPRGSATRGSRTGRERAAVPCPRAVTSRLWGHTPSQSAGRCGNGVPGMQRGWGCGREGGRKAELTFRCCRCPAGAGHGILMSPQGQDARGLWELQSFPFFPSFGIPLPSESCGHHREEPSLEPGNAARVGKQRPEFGKSGFSSPVSRRNYPVIVLR